jgi:thiamine biosynthesis protein ThiS
MTVYINGKKEEIGEGMNVSGILSARNIRPEVVTVELNDRIVNRSEYGAVLLKEKDRLEFVYYMGGGYAF